MYVYVKSEHSTEALLTVGVGTVKRHGEKKTS